MDLFYYTTNFDLSANKASTDKESMKMHPGELSKFNKNGIINTRPFELFIRCDNVP